MRFRLFACGLFLLGVWGCNNPDTALIGRQKTTSKWKRPVQGKVIYGSDDRQDVYEVNDVALVALSESTVGLMEDRNVKKIDSQWSELKTTSYAKSYRLCSSERFFDQETAAFCSGFLIGDDLVATAGHCVENLAGCKKTKFVFGFAVTQKGTLPKKIQNSEIFSCSQVVHTQKTAADFAIVKLDRKVSGHTPLILRKGKMPSAGTGLVVIGHPAGLPTKISGGANVRRENKGFFVANLDTYGGNSGSAVFNANTLQVEGILVRGEADFVASGSCAISNVCTDAGCRGEDVTDVAEMQSHIP